MKLRFFVLFFVLFLLGCTSDYVVVNEKKYFVEIADDPIEQQKGLMNKELKENEGMLFVFEKKGKYGFWMKNTIISLDIIFIDDDKVVDVISADPCDVCEVYYPNASANYVLEVIKGSNITIGDKVEIYAKV